MMRVLITRPEPDAADFAERCRKAGLTPVISPLMRVSFEKTPINTTGIGALAFTSANGVRAFSAADDARDLPVFAIGDATGRQAQAAGFDKVSIANGDITSLTKLIDQHRRRINGEILHIAGAHRAGDLVNALELRGLQARRAVLYEANAVDVLPKIARTALVDSPQVDWATFFSPRTAALFLALVKKSGIEDRLRSIRAAFLSEAVADVFADAIWKSGEIAPHPDADAVITTIKRHAQHERA